MGKTPAPPSYTPPREGHPVMATPEGRPVGKPGILQVGNILQVGTQVWLRNWALTYCAAKCGCHRDRVTGEILSPLDEDLIEPVLGLRKTRPCACCEPWTVAELRSIITDAIGILLIETANADGATGQEEEWPS